MQVESNWSNVAGRVAEVQQTSTVKDFGVVKIDLEKVTPVEGFKSLVDPAKQKTLTVMFPVELISKFGIKAGDKIEARVRRVDLQRSYVHREHISVTHPNP